MNIININSFVMGRKISFWSMNNRPMMIFLLLFLGFSVAFGKSAKNDTQSPTSQSSDDPRSSLNRQKETGHEGDLNLIDSDSEPSFNPNGDPNHFLLLNPNFRVRLYSTIQMRPPGGLGLNTLDPPKVEETVFFQIALQTQSQHSFLRIEGSYPLFNLIHIAFNKGLYNTIDNGYSTGNLHALLLLFNLFREFPSVDFYFTTRSVGIDLLSQQHFLEASDVIVTIRSKTGNELLSLSLLELHSALDWYLSTSNFSKEVEQISINPTASSSDGNNALAPLNRRWVYFSIAANSPLKYTWSNISKLLDAKQRQILSQAVRNYSAHPRSCSIL